MLLPCLEFHCSSLYMVGLKVKIHYLMCVSFISNMSSVSNMSSFIVEEKRRIWNANYKRWIQNDPLFDLKYELCYSYVYKGVPGGWFLKKMEHN